MKLLSPSPESRGYRRLNYRKPHLNTTTLRNTVLFIGVILVLALCFIFFQSPIGATDDSRSIYGGPSWRAFPNSEGMEDELGQLDHRDVGAYTQGPVHQGTTLLPSFPDLTSKARITDNGRSPPPAIGTTDNAVQTSGNSTTLGTSFPSPPVATPTVVTMSSEPGAPGIIEVQEIDCDGVAKGDSTAVDLARKFNFDAQLYQKGILDVKDPKKRCAHYDTAFKFRRKALSEEEASYPLAYGILAYHDFIQFMLMLSEFYEPQNAYCVAVPLSAEDQFRELIDELPHCFKNIHIVQVEETKWGNYEIIRAVHTCLTFLDELDVDWKYYQYLSGVDMPLKTNLEFVRIFKALNETSIAEVSGFQSGRLNGKKITDSPLPLWKSSMSATFPRVVAHHLTSTTAFKQLKFLKGTTIADEALWTTLLGNPDLFPLPTGGWSAASIQAFRKKEQKALPKRDIPACPSNKICYRGGMIARMQTWGGGKCGGKWASGSCVYGVSDVAQLIQTARLVAHKLYLNFQPAALMCLARELDKRRKSDIDRIDYESYALIPQVELKQGKKITELTWPEYV